jgi:hypothetical protein
MQGLSPNQNFRRKLLTDAVVLSATDANASRRAMILSQWILSKCVNHVVSRCRMVITHAPFLLLLTLPEPALYPTERRGADR